MNDLVLNNLTLFFVVALIGIVLLLKWISKRPVRGLYLTFFATSILITPYLPLVREKFTATEVLMLLTWIALFFNTSAWTSRRNPLHSSQRMALILGWSFIVWVAFSYFINNLLLDEGVIGSSVEALNYLYGFLMFRTVLILVDDWEKWNNCLYAWILGAVVVSIVGVLAVSGHAPAWAYDDFSSRVSSTLRTENQVPSFLLPVFVAVLFMAANQSQPVWRRVLLIILIVGMLITVFGTGSRTAMAMLAICMAGVSFLVQREWAYKAFNRSIISRLALGLIIGLFVYVAAVIGAYDGSYSLAKTPPWQRPVVLLFDWAQGVKPLDVTREQQLEFVQEHFIENIMLGTGPKLAGISYHVSEIHNTYASLIVEVGIPGGILFLMWLFYVLRLGWRSGASCSHPFQRLLVLSLCIGMLALMVYSSFMFGLRQRNIWLLAGLLVAVPRLRMYAPADQLGTASKNLSGA